MRRAFVACAAALAACDGDAPPPATPSGPLAADAPAITAALRHLPGAIYYLSEESPPVVYRIAGGVRAVAAALPAGDDGGVTPLASPDGTLLAVVGDRDGPRRIYLQRGGGGSPRRLTERTEVIAVAESHPAWSPDSAMIAYVVTRGPRTHVWVRDVASGSEEDLTPEGIYDHEPAFSPDGRWIVVTRTRGREVDLWALPVGPGEPVRITTARFRELHPRWR